MHHHRLHRVVHDLPQRGHVCNDGPHIATELCDLSVRAVRCALRLIHHPAQLFNLRLGRHLVVHLLQLDAEALVDERLVRLDLGVPRRVRAVW